MNTERRLAAQQELRRCLLAARGVRPRPAYGPGYREDVARMRAVRDDLARANSAYRATKGELSHAD